MFRRATLCLVLSAAIGCGRSAETEDQALAGPPPTSDAEAPAPPPASGPVQIEMKNVRLHVAEGVVLDVRALRGEMISTKRGVPPVFDDSESYTIRLDYADIGMDMASLTRLMNDHVLAYEDAPMSDVEIDIDDGQLRQKGKLEKGIPIPFSMKASVAATPDGRLRLHAESISALGVPATRLLDLLGLELDDLVSLKERRGVDVADDDIVIDPGGVLPPPVMRGRLTHAEIANGELRQVFGSAKAARPLSPPDPRANYVYFSGASIRFGKLTMDGADLQLIDADDRDPFDFYPERYERQLIAGYSKNTPRGGLKTYMPDYSDLERNTKGTKDTKSTKDTKTGFVGERRASRRRSRRAAKAGSRIGETRR